MSKTFVVSVILAEALGVSLVVILLVLLSHMGGLALDFDKPGAFLLHPILMTFAFVFLYGNAILVFKAGAAAGVSKFSSKLVHFIIQLVAFVISVLGVFVVFRYQGIHGYLHMTSLHSWIGICTVILFGVQLLLGFLFFLGVRPREAIRAAYKPIHVFFGFFIIGMVAVTVLTGLTEQLFFDAGGFEAFSPKVFLANFFGLAVVAFIGVVTYTVTTQIPQREDDGAIDEEEKSSLLEMK